MNFRRLFTSAAAVAVLFSGISYVPVQHGMSVITAEAATGTYEHLSYSLYEDHAEITGFDGAVSTVTVPETIEGVPVTVIASQAFEENSALKKLTLPDTITEIGRYAFWNCQNMVLDKFPSGLKTIGKDAFYRCNQLKDVVLPEGVTAIPDSAFYLCSGLTSIKALGKITSIDRKAFIYCRKLVSADFGGEVKTVGESAFRECNSLVDLNLSDSLESIGYHAFSACPAMVDLSQSAMNMSQSNLIGAEYNRTAVPITSFITDITEDTVSVLTVNDNKFMTAGSYSYSGNTYKMLSEKVIPFELPLYGGAYFTDKYNFVFFGQFNKDEDNDCEVIRAVKYDKNWNRLGSSSIRNCNIYYPFDGGLLRADDNGNSLIVHTCREMYMTEDGKHHQTSFSFTLDKESMKITQLPEVYASHSFDQYVRTTGGKNFFVDHGDAYPRSVDIQTDSGASIDVLKICGENGDNDTGVSLGGFEYSSDNLIIAGCSMEQNQTGDINFDAQRDIFVGVADKELKSAKINWITDHHNSDDAYEPHPMSPHLVKVGSDTFYLLWEEYPPNGGDPELKLTILNGKGEPVTRIFSLGSGNPLSDCQPVLTPTGGITWFYIANDGDDLHFTTINPNGGNTTPTQPPVTAPAETAAPVSTTAIPKEQPTATTRAGGQTSEQQKRTTFTLSFNGLTTNDKIGITINKSDGYIKQMQFIYYDSDGIAHASIIGGIFSDKYLSGPGTTKEYFTLPEPLESMQIVFNYTGEDPELELTYEGRDTTVETTKVTTAAKPVTTQAVTTTTVQTGSTSSNAGAGDANCDGKLNVADAVTILQYVANRAKYSLSADGIQNADVDGQSGITGGDAIAVQQYDAGIVKSLPLKQ